MTGTSTQSAVRGMYEDFPTPKRDPDEERRRLVIRPMESLARINHFVFGGEQAFGEGVRLLAAGAGTGDEVIYLAEQLRDRGGTLVYLDSSHAAMEVCRQRAAIRQLDNIEFRVGLIEDLAPESFGLFDYIHCVGVLHQLADPLEGMRRLVSVLSPTGGLGLMARTPEGLAGADCLRQLVDQVSQDGASFKNRYKIGLGLAASLTPEHPFFRRQPREVVLREMTNDPGQLLEEILTATGAGFSVGAIHDLVAAVDLTLVEFVPTDMALPLFTLFYNPDFYVTDPKLSRKLATLPMRRRQELAELLNGGMASHGLYCARGGNREALPTDEAMVPSLLLAPSAFQIANNRLLITDYEGRSYEFEATPSIQLMFHLIDGEKTIGEIVAEGNRLLQQVGLPAVDLLATFLHLYSNLRNFGWIALRHKSVSAFARHDHLYFSAAGWVAP